MAFVDSVMLFENDEKKLKLREPTFKVADCSRSRGITHPESSLSTSLDPLFRQRRHLSLVDRLA